MHRTSLVVLAGAAALALTPTAAGAHGKGKHHGGSHARHHAKHARRVHTHIEHFRPSTAAAGGTSSTTSPNPSGDTAGTVASFDGTTLVITLNDGSTATGTVTPTTAVTCPSSATNTTGTGSDQSSSGDQNSGSSGDQTDQTSGSSSDQGDQGDQGDQNDQGDAAASGDGSSQDSTAGSCSSSALTQGAVVREAALKVSSTGSSWLEVKLG